METDKRMTIEQMERARQKAIQMGAPEYEIDMWETNQDLEWNRQRLANRQKNVVVAKGVRINGQVKR